LEYGRNNETNVPGKLIVNGRSGRTRPMLQSSIALEISPTKTPLNEIDFVTKGPKLAQNPGY